jgi:hypothetical protein
LECGTRTKRFNEDFASKILTSPLITHVPSDRLIWKAEKNEIYSVKSAYKLCVEELVDITHLRRPGFWSGSGQGETCHGLMVGS